MRVLYVCTELFPMLKTGGLGDVSAGLPPALRSLGCDVRLLLPAFAAIQRNVDSSQCVGALPKGSTPWGHAPTLPAVDLVLAKLKGLADPAYLMQSNALYGRSGNPYLGPDGKEWGDNALRFAALGWAAASLGQGMDPLWVPDIIHCHDWHAGLAPAYIRAFADAGEETPATVFTIHNLAYQGLFPKVDFPKLGLPDSQFDVDGLEYFGQTSFMKAAIQFSDRITTVSPTYAREILTPSQGCGLDGLLRERSDQLSGILNGVEYPTWNPATDAFLSTHFDVDAMEGKVLAKKNLQTLFGLEARPTALVFGVASRLTAQKGLHLLPLVLDELVSRGGQLALLGQGDAHLEQEFVDAALRYPGQVGVHIGYEETTAHAIVAGADVILMPSAFEPCGLTQLYGLRYGALPLVRRVGGMADTVVDCTLENLDDGSATGFVFDDFSAQGLRSAVRRAFSLSTRPEWWCAVQQRGMALRFDWIASAQHYLAIFQSLRPGAASGKGLLPGSVST